MLTKAPKNNTFGMLMLDQVADTAVARLYGKFYKELISEVDICMREINPNFQHLHRDDLKDLTLVVRGKIEFRIRNLIGENHNAGKKIGRLK